VDSPPLIRDLVLLFSFQGTHAFASRTISIAKAIEYTSNSGFQTKNARLNPPKIKKYPHEEVCSTHGIPGYRPQFGEKGRGFCCIRRKQAQNTLENTQNTS
jgi:hypothetical protein